ncbi:hypothetical protein [Roseateles puraquae]|jgi:hypothetical protein|uniref:hypothetical protein n=1 Tax=Roseateles puraquae TaxID=431059 RepID=UPI001F4DC811|nr:hypothetical protein [Roseateles puraquae]
MSSVIKLALPVELLSLVRLAHLLQGVEHQTVDPHQYRLLVEKLSAELREHQAHPALATVLDHFPAAAELYENLQYAHAGLCRAPLEASLQSELAARELLARVSR